MSERESNARREIKEASIGGLAHKLKDTAPQRADASEEGPGPAGEAPDRDVPADNAAPQQDDASGEGQGPAGEAPDRDVPADHAVPQQNDASGEGQGPAGEAPDRKQEIFELLQRAIEGNEDAAAVAQELGVRRDAQLMEAAVEIELFERKSATTIRELMQSLTAAQTLLNRAFEDSHGKNNFQEAITAYERIKSRFWDSLAEFFNDELEQIQDELHYELHTLKENYRDEIRALMSGKTAPVSFQQRVVREKWLLVAALIVGVALGSALVSIQAFWGSMASLLHP